MTRTVRTWQEKFPAAEFCRALGIPEADAPHLLTVHAGPVGVSLQFVHNLSATQSRQWTRTWWSARRFCKRLGLPGAWGRCLVSSGPDAGGTIVELRFVR